MKLNLYPKRKSVAPLAPIFLALLVIFSVSVSPCSAQTNTSAGDQIGQDIWRAPYTNLTTEEAWAIYDSDADVCFLDVREQSEWDDGHVPDAILMPWNSGYLQDHHNELPSKPIIVYCRSGYRSAQASQFLENNGHSDISNMLDGFNGWKAMPTPTPTVLNRYEFDSGTESWGFAGEINPFDPPDCCCTTGCLASTPQGSTNCFSYWYSPDVPVSNQTLYRSIWTVGSSVTNPDDSLEFRLRVNQKGAWSGWTRTVKSNLSHAPSFGNNKTYDLYFRPSVSDSGDNVVVFSFDIMSFDPADDTTSWLYLDELQLEKVSLFITKEVTEYTFGSGNDGWTFMGRVDPFDEPLTTETMGSIGLNPNGSVNCFSYWYSPDIPIENNKAYRARWKVKSSATNADNCVQFRLRANQKGSWCAWTRTVNSYLQNAPSSSESKKYELFITPTVTGSSDDDIVLSFDILSFDPSDDTNSWIYLDSLLLEEATIVP